MKKDAAASAFGNLLIKYIASSAGWLHSTRPTVLGFTSFDRPPGFGGSCHQVKSTKLIDLSATLSFHSMRVAKVTTKTMAVSMTWPLSLKLGHG